MEGHPLLVEIFEMKVFIIGFKNDSFISFKCWRKKYIHLKKKRNAVKYRPRLLFLLLTSMASKVVYKCQRLQNSQSTVHSLKVIWCIAESICTPLLTANIRPVNLHPLFLFWKPGSVCDPEKNQAPGFLKKAGCKKPRSLLFKKRRGSLVFSLFE